MSTIRDPAVITTAGRQMMTAGGDISYTKAVLFGQDISHLTQEQLVSLTSIGNPLMTVPVGISDKNNAGANTTVVLEATFQNTDLKADLPYKAVGFFAKKDNGEEKLVILGVANSGAYLAAASPDGVASDALDVKVAIAIGDATSVTAVVDPAGSVTPATLNGAINKATHDLTAKIDTKVDKTDVTAQFATKADKTTVEQELTTKANASDVYTKSQTDGKLGQKITFVKCDSPQAAYDASTKPAADGSIVFGIYDMNNEPSEAYVAGQKINIEWLYNHLTDLQSTVNSGLVTKANQSDLNSTNATVESQASEIASLKTQLNDAVNQISYIKANYIEGRRFAKSQEAQATAWENENPQRIAFITDN